MKKVISLLALVAGLAIFAATSLFGHIPQATPTAVIGEKSENGVAVLLPEKMTSSQAQLLKTAYDVAKADGHKDPELVQAVLLQETRAGAAKGSTVANPGPDAYFGPMQIKLAAAREVLSSKPELYSRFGFQTRTDDEVKAHLILNQRFNIEVGSKYLKLLQDRYGFSGLQLLNAYNRGPGGVQAVDDTYHYGVGAQQKLAAWKQRRHASN